MKVGISVRQQELLDQIEKILSTAADGRLGITKETAAIDFKEEAGRRNGKELLPGLVDNPQAATKLANEVACMANTPGGGALVVGVEDGSGRIIGTELDIDKLRQRIYSGVGVAPDIQEREVEGLRILVILVAESSEPVEDTHTRLRWRVGDSCKEVDRSEWWQHRDATRGFDPMAVASSRTLTEVRPAALAIARRHRDVTELSMTDEEFLRSIGAVRSDGKLSEAAALLFCSMGRKALELTHFNVPSGQVLNVFSVDHDASLMEQIDVIERTLDVLNTKVTVERGFNHRQIRRVPDSAIREAILNGVIHRDWNRSTPTELRWTEADSMFEVRSPGGFCTGVTAENILSQKEARYPALADLFRAIGLVDKQGVGVDRMYRSLISLGHNPPIIQEVAGPYVEVALVGGEPKTPVMDLVEAIRPSERQEDYRLSIILYYLLHHPFIDVSDLAHQLQADEESAKVALEVARQTVIGGKAMIQRYHDVWILGAPALAIIEQNAQDCDLSPLLPYRSTEDAALRTTIQQWLKSHESITTGDLSTLAGVARGTAKKTLDNLVDDNMIISVGRGRSSRYEPKSK